MMKVVAGILILTVTITGCSTLGGGEGGSGRAALECGAVGAGLAAAICLAAGGNAATCGGAAAGGGALGAVGCYTYAEKLTDRRKKLAGREHDLDAQLEFATGAVEDSKKANADLTKRVAQVNKDTDKTAERMKIGTVSQQELAKAKEALQKEEKLANEQVAVGQSALKDMKGFQDEQKRKPAVDSAALAELDKKIEEQERLLAETQRQTTAISTARMRL
jgi:hypothetical protein